MKLEFIERVNSLEIESDPELTGNGYIRVYRIEDGSGQSVFCVRIDIRWVSIGQAVSAIEDTYLQDLLYDEVGHANVADILVTRNTEDNEVSFECLSANGKQFSIPSGGRFRA